MAQILPWVALVLSGLVLGYGASRAAGAKGSLVSGLQVPLTAAALLLLLGAALTLPGGSPWSAGQGLWPGFLLGGAGVLLAALFGRWERFGEPNGVFVAAAARIAAAVLPTAVLLLLYPMLRHGILETLSGMALGGIAAGLVLTAADLSGRETGSAAEAGQFGALTLVALATATFLAAYHRDPTGIREWLALPAVLGATGAAALTVRGVIANSNPWITAGVLGVPLALMAWLIGYKLNGTPGFFFTVLIGLAVFAVVAWLERVDEGEEGPGLRADVGLLAALILLGGAALAFREWSYFYTLGRPNLKPEGAGYGVALTALCGVFVWGAAGGRRVLLPGGLALMLLLALYRVFTESTGYERGFQPDFLYFYVALIAGALLPALLSGSLYRGIPTGTGPSVARVVLAGAAAAIAPLALWLLVGERPQAAMLVGLAVGAGFLLSRQVAGSRAPGEVAAAGLLALCAGWAAVRFTFLLNPLALGTRMQRVTALAIVGAVALVAVVVTALMERRQSTERAAGEPAN